MRNPRRIRVTERRFLNLPGYHGGAYVLAYVEDTTDRASANSAVRAPPRRSTSRSATATAG